jgi:hypothetical protein
MDTTRPTGRERRGKAVGPSVRLTNVVPTARLGRLQRGPSWRLAGIGSTETEQPWCDRLDQNTLRRSPIASTFPVDLDADLTPAFARPQHLSQPRAAASSASPVAFAVAGHRSMTTHAQHLGEDGDLDHAGVRPAARRRRRATPKWRRRQTVASDQRASSRLPGRLHLPKQPIIGQIRPRA